MEGLRHHHLCGNKSNESMFLSGKNVIPLNNKVDTFFS